MLVGRDTLRSIEGSVEGGQSIWSTPFSGRIIDEGLAAKLREVLRKTHWPQGDALDDLGSDAPDRRCTTVVMYSRDPEIRKRVKIRAKGKCELCGEPGIISTNGTPYLECHHIIALANEGEDRMTNVIALCPKDHREAHFGERSEELERQMSNNPPAKPGAFRM